MMFYITIKGRVGKYLADVTGFYKHNFNYLKKRIEYIYGKEYGEFVPKEFHNINNIKELRRFVKEEMSDMDNYPYGFKHIDGVYCLYECYG